MPTSTPRRSAAKTARSRCGICKILVSRNQRMARPIYPPRTGSNTTVKLRSGDCFTFHGVPKAWVRATYCIAWTNRQTGSPYFPAAWLKFFGRLPVLASHERCIRLWLHPNLFAFALWWMQARLIDLRARTLDHIRPLYVFAFDQIRKFFRWPRRGIGAYQCEFIFQRG